MALELARSQSIYQDTIIISLEGSMDIAIGFWPRLRPFRHQLVFMGKKSGLDFGLTRRLYKMFAWIQPSVVHTHHIGPLLYAGPAARMAGVKCVHTEHDAWHLSNSRRRLVARLAVAAAKPVLVADAPPVASAMMAALDCAPPRVILNGVDTMKFVPGNQDQARRALALPLDARIIGVSARLEPVKGVDVAIRALAKMENHSILAIAGSGSEEMTLRRLAAKLGVKERVVFLGHVDDMTRFYAAIDVLCLSSHAEGLPLSLLEAQSSGVPVVASLVGGVPAAVCPRTGQLVPAGDTDAFAAALMAAPHAPCDEARAFVVCGASLASAAAAYLDLYAGGHAEPEAASAVVMPVEAACV